MNILIPTMPDDNHAVNVHLALKKLGHKSWLWYTSDFPIMQTISLQLEKNEVIWHASGVDLDIKNDLFDVVWYRRPRAPVLSNSIHPDDKKNAHKEVMSFFNNIWRTIAPNARWINPFKPALDANNKLLQLKLAVQQGLKIPATLISNDPIKIKEFIQNNVEGDVIYKTLTTPVWIKEQDALITYTKTIREQDLPQDSILQLTPGIFQKKISKAFELRITMMGDYPIAVRINSQEHPKGTIDWRYIPAHELVVEEFELPTDIVEKCVKFMHKLGLVFGCIDFIVTPEGEYYFLEINEQGQFLWIEDLNPKIKMLDKFIAFLLNHPTFINNDLSYGISVADYIEEAQKYRSLAIESHIDPDLSDQTKTP